MTTANRLLRSCVPAATGILAAVGLTIAGPAGAAEGAWGTPAAAGPAATAAAAVPASIDVPIRPFIRYAEASYGTGGVALRNRTQGGIHISGVDGATQDAYVYWAYIFQTSAPASQVIRVKRLFPLPNALATVKGAKIGTGPSPCWGGAGIAVYRGRVPVGVASGNGMYQVFLPATASGSSSGADPWAGAGVFSLAEGASMVLVGKGSAFVALYDAPLAGKTFGLSGVEDFTYSLITPVAAPGNQALWDNIGADGQTGISRSGGASNETTTINGVAVAGPGGAVSDSDWDGSSGWPLPQLWDDTGHDITKAAPKGTTGLKVTFHAVADCLTPVANVLSLR